MSNQVFQEVLPAHQMRSAFDLSYEKKFTCDMGQLIPIVCDEAVPGDVWKIGNSAVLRFQPMVAPILHQVDVKTFYFFVPYRLLDEDFEDFITKGVSGNDVVTLPIWNPQDYSVPADVYAMGSLWDFMGLPLLDPPVEVCPIDYPRRAYYFIWNEFFRDETLGTAVDITIPGAFDIKNVAWEKDYFTSALPFRQRGTAPALPVVGTGAATFDIPFEDAIGSGDDWQAIKTDNSLAYHKFGSDANYVQAQQNMSYILSNNNTIDGSSFTSVDIADLRLAFQLQVWMERNARAGVRYTEFLHAHFAVSPRDERLQRPEYIGGTSNSCIISEVLQTNGTGASGTTTPQGNLAGHGIGVQASEIGSYRVEEYGVIVGLMVVKPRSAYQDGVNRQWLRRTTFDFYFPEFSGLSEQEIFNAELCTKNRVADPSASYNLGVFGYTGRYNEMRYKPSMVCSEMRTTFKYWHLGRIFDPASPPTLNEAFIKCSPRKDIFADTSDPCLICSVGNHLQVVRPLPFMAEPMQLGR